MNEIIRLDDISKRYSRNVWGIKNCSLSIDKGSVSAFIGHNGSGKTTIIKIILSLIKPTKGNVIIQGKKTSINSSNKSIGYLPENIDLSLTISIQEFLLELSQSRGLSLFESVSNIKSLLDFFDLSQYQKRIIRNCSKGMKQKIGIIQAFVHKPEIVILDEPTSGLDPVAKNKLFTYISKYIEDNKTVIMSSHRLDEIQNIANYAIVINNNELVLKKNMAEILQEGNLENYYLNLIKENSQNETI